MQPLFSSFWMAGFECSSHRRADGVRLDLLRATAHDRFVRQDYRRMAEMGLLGIRDGLRWHRIETAPGRYDWDSWLPMVDAGLEFGLEINWDIFHYGLPDFHDVRSADFAKVYADYAAAAAELHLRHTGRPIRACPLNEISFYAWALDEGYFPPSVADHPRGWVKRRLVEAAVAAAHAMEAVCPGRRFFWAEPLIHVEPHDNRRETVRRAEANRQSQFEVYDMLMGRAAPELGGHPEMVDAIGVNFYPHNQWYWEGPTIPMGQHAYRPLRDMLLEISNRYSRPLFIAETGAEGSARPAWLHYVCDEVRAAMAAGVQVEAICLYPITEYPGWDNGRHCHVGLLGNADRHGERPLFEPLLAEIERQREIFDALAASAGPAPALALATRR